MAGRVAVKRVATTTERSLFASGGGDIVTGSKLSRSFVNGRQYRPVGPVTPVGQGWRALGRRRR